MNRMTASEIISQVKSGKRFLVKSYLKPILIDAKCIERFEAAGIPVLRDDKDGRGYRIKTGKSSVYVFPEQTCIIE